MGSEELGYSKGPEAPLDKDLDHLDRIDVPLVPWVLQVVQLEQIEKLDPGSLRDTTMLRSSGDSVHCVHRPVYFLGEGIFYLCTTEEIGRSLWRFFPLGRSSRNIFNVTGGPAKSAPPNGG